MLINAEKVISVKESLKSSGLPGFEHQGLSAKITEGSSTVTRNNFFSPPVNASTAIAVKTSLKSVFVFFYSLS